MNKRIHRSLLALILVTLLGSVSLVSAANDIFKGGAADGYDDLFQNSTVTFVQINNAGGATNILAESAWLNGLLTCTGSAPATVYVYWGTTDGVTNKDEWSNFADCGTHPESTLISTNIAVDSYAVYYYRYAASNTQGEAWAWPSESFTVPGPPITDNGAGATLRRRISATLNGNLTAGNTADIVIYWGTDTNNWGNTNSLGEVAEGAYSVDISGITTGAQYYYQSYASNLYGECYTDITNFTAAEEVVFKGGDADGYDEFWVIAVLKGLYHFMIKVF